MRYIPNARIDSTKNDKTSKLSTITFAGKFCNKNKTYFLPIYKMNRIVKKKMALLGEQNVFINIRG